MASPSLNRQAELIAACYALAQEHDSEVRTTSTNTTEGGAQRVSVTFVLLPDDSGRPRVDGDAALNGTPMGSAVQNGDGEAFSDFAAPRAHRPGAEGEA